MITPAIRHPGLLSAAVKLTLASTLLALASFGAHAEEQPAATPQPPDILLGPLFNDVQTANCSRIRKPLPMRCPIAIR